MLKRWQILGAAVAISSLLLILILLWLHTSSWFLWSLTPSGKEFAVLINYSRDPAGVINDLTSRYQLVDYIPFDSATASRFVYSRTNDSETLIVVPRLLKQRSLERQLKHEGWQVNRFGLALIVGPRQSIGSALVQAARQTIIRRLTLSPLAMVIENNRATLAQRQDNRLTIATNPNTKSFTLYPTSTTNQPMTDLQASLPSQYLQILPDEFKAQWNQHIRQQLKLTKTKPDIISELASHSAVVARLQGDNLAFGVVGNVEQFAAAADTWLSQEIAQTRPVRTAFRLPDGTIGFEQQPSERQIAFQSQPDADDCHAPIEATHLIWLCQRDNQIVLTNHKPLALNLLTASTADTWHLHIGPELSQHLPLPALTNLFARQDDQGIFVELTF